MSIRKKELPKSPQHLSVLKKILPSPPPLHTPLLKREMVILNLFQCITVRGRDIWPKLLNLALLVNDLFFMFVSPIREHRVTIYCRFVNNTSDENQGPFIFQPIWDSHVNKFAPTHCDTEAPIYYGQS